MTNPLIDGTDSVDIKPVRIRWYWGAYLGLLIVMFVVGVYPYFVVTGPPHAFRVAQTVVDLLVLYGLFGFVVRKPIRRRALRVVFIIVAALLCVRALVVLFVVGPILFPWIGDTESFVTLLILLGTPLLLLNAFVLWQYATKS
jgi:hypothetical protein